jgi:hypothetical protein
MRTTLKDWPKVCRKLKSMCWKNEDEKIRFARSLAATPDERWEMNDNCLKALGLLGGVRSWRDLEGRKAKLRRVENPQLWRLQLSNRELANGRLYGFVMLEEGLCTA